MNKRDRVIEDGIFGNMTRDAIFTFQSIFGMPITGVVNRATWDRLIQEAYGERPQPEIPPFPGNLSVGASGPNVLFVQRAINKIAPNHPGRLWILQENGNFDNMLRDAIFAFQSIFGLLITGVVNRVTWDRLIQEAYGVKPQPVTQPEIPGVVNQLPWDSLMQESANAGSGSWQGLMLRDGGIVSNCQTNNSIEQWMYILLLLRLICAF